jgi:hypothetical protein
VSGNVGCGDGLKRAIEANKAAVEASEAARKKDAFKLRDLFTKALVQLRILNVHQAEMRGEEITEKDLEHIK